MIRMLNRMIKLMKRSLILLRWMRMNLKLIGLRNLGKEQSTTRMRLKRDSMKSGKTFTTDLSRKSWLRNTVKFHSQSIFALQTQTKSRFQRVLSLFKWTPISRGRSLFTTQRGKTWWKECKSWFKPKCRLADPMTSSPRCWRPTSTWRE